MCRSEVAEQFCLTITVLGESLENRVRPEEIRRTCDRRIYREIETCWPDEAIVDTLTGVLDDYIIRGPPTNHHQPLVIFNQDVCRIRSRTRFPGTLSVRPP